MEYARAVRRLLGLGSAALVAGCSVFIPPHRYDPVARKTEDGHASCPSYAYPGLDIAFGAPLVILGIIVSVAASQPPDHPLGGIVQGVAQDYGYIFLGTGAVWSASAIYGFMRNGDCHEQLDHMTAVTAPADAGHATRAPPPPAATPP